MVLVLSVTKSFEFTILFMFLSKFCFDQADAGAADSSDMEGKATACCI